MDSSWSEQIVVESSKKEQNETNSRVWCLAYRNERDSQRVNVTECDHEHIRMHKVWWIVIRCG